MTTKHRLQHLERRRTGKTVIALVDLRGLTEAERKAAIAAKHAELDAAGQHAAHLLLLAESDA